MAVDPLQQLKLLAELHQSGVLTDAEFATKKSELLAQVGSGSTGSPTGSLPEPPGVNADRTAAQPRAENAGPAVSETPATVSPEDIAHWQNEVAARQKEFRQRKAEAEELEKRLRNEESSHAGKSSRGRYPELLLWLRAISARAPGGLMSVAGGVAGLWAIGSVFAMIAVTLSPLAILLALLIGGATGLLVALHLFFLPDNDGLQKWKLKLQSDAVAAGQKIAGTKDAILGMQASVDAAQAKLQEAAIVLDRLNSVFHSRRHRLQTTDWPSLRGAAFVNFLKELFEEQGFTVQPTKSSGHPGIDLIVGRGGLRIAVQAKGQQGTISSNAVQEAHAGMAVYKCQRCVIVTNAMFNSAATNLANQIGCRLIDARQLSALVMGKTEL